MGVLGDYLNVKNSLGAASDLHLLLRTKAIYRRVMRFAISVLLVSSHIEKERF
jgi:hypothetical protein